MTNIQELKSMVGETREKFLSAYENHPLKDYIDWDSFFESDDGNEMHFLCCYDVFVDENDMTNIILEYFSDDEGLDYMLTYVIDEDCFYEVPVWEAD